MIQSLATRTAELLRRDESARLLQSTPALLGFDGFIDTVCHAVDKRVSATEYSRIATLKEYGERIAAAAGQSTNLESVPVEIKIGGNGPIMALAMVSVGANITYCGMTGYPQTQSVFQDLAARSRLLPLADAALTDAIEFDDGKLILGKHATVAQVSYDNIQQRVGEATWRAEWQDARFIGMVNWTMLPYLTEIWKRLLEDFKDERGKTFFFDLADPQKRPRDHLREALSTLARFQEQGEVILGLNEKEAYQAAHVLGLEKAIPSKVTPATIAALAASIRAALDIEVCVVHPTAFAAAADRAGTAVAAGLFVQHPKISTGAGDHFNGGFCCGRILGAALDESLQIGVATSGFYVRHAVSPTRLQLVEFLREL